MSESVIKKIKDEKVKIGEIRVNEDGERVFVPAEALSKFKDPHYVPWYAQTA